MIIVPVISLFLGPVVAVPVLNVIDTITSLPMLPPAMRRCHWRAWLRLCVGRFLQTVRLAADRGSGDFQSCEIARQCQTIALHLGGDRLSVAFMQCHLERILIRS